MPRDLSATIPSDDAIIRQARTAYAKLGGDVEIDATPDIALVQEGAWVSAWVWVPYTDVRQA